MQNHTHTNIYSSPWMVSSHSACGLSWGRRWGEREKWGRRWHNLPNTTSHSGTRKLVCQPGEPAKIKGPARTQGLCYTQHHHASAHFWMLSTANLVPPSHTHTEGPRTEDSRCLPPAHRSLRRLPNRPRSTQLGRSLSDSLSPASPTAMVIAHARCWAQRWWGTVKTEALRRGSADEAKEGAWAPESAEGDSL